MKKNNQVKEFVKDVLEESARQNLDLEALEKFYSEEIATKFRAALTMGEILKSASSVDLSGSDALRVPVYFKSDGYHIKASTVLYVSPPPESGIQPYFLIDV